MKIPPPEDPVWAQVVRDHNRMVAERPTRSERLLAHLLTRIERYDSGGVDRDTGARDDDASSARIEDWRAEVRRGADEFVAGLGERADWFQYDFGSASAATSFPLLAQPGGRMSASRWPVALSRGDGPKLHVDVLQNRAGLIVRSRDVRSGARLAIIVFATDPTRVVGRRVAARELALGVSFQRSELGFAPESASWGVAVAALL